MMQIIRNNFYRTRRFLYRLRYNLFGPGPRYGYMCKTDFDHELGYASDGSKIFSSVKSLKKNMPSVSECGIIKVKIVQEKIVQKSVF